MVLGILNHFSEHMVELGHERLLLVLLDVWRDPNSFGCTNLVAVAILVVVCLFLALVLILLLQDLDDAFISLRVVG